MAFAAVKFIVRGFYPFSCELREKLSQACLCESPNWSRHEQKMCQQLSSSAEHQCDSDTVYATVLSGQAETAIPAWMGLHSVNYSFLTVL